MPRKNLRVLASTLLAAWVTAGAAAQGLVVGPSDVRIEPRDDGGYDLFVRKTPGIASILLTESTKDPAMKADNFAYRANEHNDVNGNELRMLNGKALPASSKLYSLLSSTPIADAAFGQAFRILIPPVLVYGYPWSRSGTVSVGKGTYINIRAFAKPYADYAGAFLDNPYQIAVATLPAAPVPETPPPQPPPAQVSAPTPPADDRTSAKIGQAISASPDQSLDVVVCLDTTQSMVPYIEDIKKNLGPILRKRVSGFKSFRIGIVLFKDYWPDEYITRKYPFTADISAFEQIVKGVSVYGGGDIPEAEVEALYAAETEFDWSADKRQIILVTDAPPHPVPLGKIVFDDVVREAAAKRLDADAIIEPTKIEPPQPEHAQFENVTLRVKAIAASGASVRLLAVDSSSDPETAELGKEALDTRLLGSFAGDSRVATLGARVLVGPGAATSASGSDADAAALKAAADAGASHLILTRTRSLGGTAGGMSETVSRLLEVSTRKELERDVLWRAGSVSPEDSGTQPEFINGVREK